MITITRLLARQVKTIGRHLFGAKKYALPSVQVTTGAEGLRLAACDGERGFEYRESAPQPDCRLRAPLELFRELAANKPLPVTLAPAKRGAGVLATWQDGQTSMAQQFDLDRSREAMELLAPETFAENPPAMLRMLHEAMQTVAKDPFRYATDTVQLRGNESSVVATNGHQLLVQKGLLLGWEDDLVCHATKAFASPELPQDQPVFVGKSEKYVAVRTGPWTIYLGIERDRRYPAVDHTLWATSRAMMTWELSPGDAQFLSEHLPELPGKEDDAQPITLDLGQFIAIRARDSSGDPPTELRLRSSNFSGRPLRVSIDRRFLERAIRLGFVQVYFCGPDQSIQCASDTATFLWMPLHSDNCIPANKKAIVIESLPLAQTNASSATIPISPSLSLKPPMETTTPAATNPAPAPAAKRKRTSKSPNPAAGPIEQATGLRDELRALLSQANQLVKSLKRQRQQQRLMQTTLASLKELQAA